MHVLFIFSGRWKMVTLNDPICSILFDLMGAANMVQHHEPFFFFEKNSIISRL